jgi:hypothetical protein
LQVKKSADYAAYDRRIKARYGSGNQQRRTWSFLREKNSARPGDGLTSDGKGT